jgi:hypothetical protein
MDRKWTVQTEYGELLAKIYYGVLVKKFALWRCSLGTIPNTIEATVIFLH